MFLTNYGMNSQEDVWGAWCLRCFSDLFGWWKLMIDKENRTDRERKEN